MSSSRIFRAAACALVVWFVFGSSRAGGETRPLPPGSVVHVEDYDTDGSDELDDRLGIQSAIDAVRAGGTVRFPPGRYYVGAPNAGADPSLNKPLFISSRVHLIGAGIGRTILTLPSEVNQRNVSDPAASPCAGWTAGLITNKGNRWWDPNGAPDHDIEIAHMTLDGNRSHQSKIYGPVSDEYPASPPIPSFGLKVNVIPGGRFPAGAFDAYVRYVLPNGESDPTNHAGGDLASNSAIELTLQGPAPVGATSMIVCLGLEGEVDACGNQAYRSHEYAVQSEIRIVGPFVTEADRHLPGLLNIPGEASASFGIYLDQVTGGSFHDLEIRHCASDGIDMLQVSNSRFWGLDIHHNGRWGVAMAAFEPARNENLEFERITLRANAGGLDLEPGYDEQDRPNLRPAVRNVRFIHCSFLDHPVDGNCVNVVVGPNFEIDGLHFIDSTFEHNFRHIVIVGEGGRARNVTIQNCEFRRAINGCVSIEGVIEGVVEGCTFDRSNGSRPGQAPDFHAVSTMSPALALRRDGNGTAADRWTIRANYITPSALDNNTIAIDLATTSGHQIIANRFRANAEDTRQLGDNADVNANRWLVGALGGPGLLGLRGSTIRDNRGPGLLLQTYPETGERVVVTALADDGRAEIANRAVSTTIAFAHRFPDTEYRVRVEPSWTVTGVQVVDQTPFGFRIEWSQPAPRAGRIRWSASYRQ